MRSVIFPQPGLGSPNPGYDVALTMEFSVPIIIALACFGAFLVLAAVEIAFGVRKPHGHTR